MGIEPSLLQALDAFHKKAVEDVYTALPGIVESFDPVLMTVDVKLATRLVKRAPSGAPEYVEAPIIPSVAIAYPRGGGFAMTMPLEKGDSVLLVFSTLDAGSWELSGKVSDPVNPIRGGLSCCVAIPGWFPLGDPLSATPVAVADRESRACLGSDNPYGSQIRIDKNPSPGHVDVVRANYLEAPTSTDPKPVTTAKKVYDTLSAIFDSWTPQPYDGGAALKARWEFYKPTLLAALECEVLRTH